MLTNIITFTLVVLKVIIMYTYIYCVIGVIFNLIYI